MRNEIKKLLDEVSDLSFALFMIASIPYALVFVACACAGAYGIIDWL
jgi:hypothetical protein